MDPNVDKAEIRREVKRLQAQGASSRSIETYFSRQGKRVSKSTIAVYMRQPADAPRVTPTGRVIPPIDPPSAASREAFEWLPPEARSTYNPEIDDPEQAADTSLALLVDAELAIHGALRLALDEGRIKEVEKLTASKISTASAIAKLRPPPVLDPERDPGNIAQRDILLGKIETAVAVFETAPEVRRSIRANLDKINETAKEKEIKPE